MSGYSRKIHFFLCNMDIFLSFLPLPFCVLRNSFFSVFLQTGNPPEITQSAFLAEKTGGHKARPFVGRRYYRTASLRQAAASSRRVLQDTMGQMAAMV